MKSFVSRQKRRMLLFGDFNIAMAVAENLDDARRRLKYVPETQADAQRALDRGLESDMVDYTDDRALQELGIGKDVDAIFCLFTEDSKNVFLTISARALDHDLHIVAVHESPESEYKLIAAGADKTLNPYALSARKVENLVLRPEIEDMIERTVFGGEDLHIAELAVPANSRHAGSSLGRINLEARFDLLLLGLVDLAHGPELVFSVDTGDRIIDPGDVLVVIGSVAEIEKLRDDLDPA